jgi:transposase-like protein
VAHKRNQRRGRAYWQRRIAEYRASGLSQAAFARQRDLPVSTLQRWLKKLPDDSAVLEPVRFVELAPEPVVQVPAAMATVRVGAVSIELRQLPPPEYIAELHARTQSC